MTAKEKISGFVLSQAMNYISGNPEKNLPKLLALIDGIGWGESYTAHKRVFHEILTDPPGIGRRWPMVFGYVRKIA